MKVVMSMSSIEEQIGLPKKTIRLYDKTPIKPEHTKLIKEYLIKLYLLSNSITLEDEIVFHAKAKPLSESFNVKKYHKPIITTPPTIETKDYTVNNTRSILEIKEEIDVGQYIDENFDKVIRTKGNIVDHIKVRILTFKKEESFGYTLNKIIIDNDTNLPVLYSYNVKVFIVQS